MAISQEVNIMSNNYQNNTNNEVYTPSTYSAYRFFNSDSQLSKTTMSFSFWNSLLKISISEIIVKEGSANKIDKDNHVDMYLSPSKAKMFLEAIRLFRSNPDIYTNTGVSTNKGAIFIANGDKMFGRGGMCIVINLINNNTGNVESEAVYEFSTKDLFVITDFIDGNFNKDDSYAGSLEIDMFENLLVQFINAYTNAVASSYMECNKFNEARQFSFIKDVREKLGISKGDGSKNYNRSSWFNNNGGGSTVSDSSSRNDNTSSYEDVMSDIESMMND